MKIRQRLALRFTLVSALITGTMLIFIYVLTRGFVHADFAERLTQQANLEALHYATPHVRDVIPPGSFLLVNPITFIYSEEGKLLYKHGNNYTIPISWIAYLKQHGEFNAERGGYTTVGRRHIINNVKYLVFVSDKDLPGQHELDLLIKAILVGWLLSLVISYLAGSYFSADALEPVKRVVSEVKHITKDNLSYRLIIDKEANEVDEIDELILTFNALLSRIESAFITQKRFVQHASHELKTPLTAIMAEAELALVRDRSKEEYQRTLHVITHETERLVTITQGLLNLARLEEGSIQIEMKEVPVRQLVNDIINTFTLHYATRKLILPDEIPEGAIVGDDQLLKIAFANILDNAVKYSTGPINLHVIKNEQTIAIHVQDNGMGIPDQEINKIRSPLFRASNVRDIPGAGLGLSLVDRVIKIHKGTFEITSKEEEGTQCVITLPVTE